MNEYLSLVSKYRSAIMGISILWIMFFHFPGTVNVAIIDAIKIIGYGGVDIFLLLSGFGLYFSMSKKDSNLKNYYKKRFVRVLPEFWIYLIIGFIITMDFSFNSFWELLCCATTLGYWIPLIPYKLWYISFILFLYAIYPGYFKLFTRYGTKVFISTMAIGLVLILIYALVMVFAFNNKNEGGMIILAVSRFPVFFLGSMFGHWAKDGCNICLNRKAELLSFSVFIVAICFLFYSIVYMPNYLWTCSLYFLPFIVIAPVLCVMFAALFERLPSVVVKLFSGIGNISFELFLVHVYLYNELLEYLKISFGGNSIATVMVVALSFISAIILYKINYSLQKKLNWDY